METRLKFWKTQLEYLSAKPLINHGCSDLEPDWMEMVLGGDMTDHNLLFLKNKSDLPTKNNILVLFHFFRNIDRTSNKSLIADKVIAEVDKYWQRSNIPTQSKIWIKKVIIGLNSHYENLLKNIKRETETEIFKRDTFVTEMGALFDIASPEAEKQLRKDKVLGVKKAQEDLMFLESQRTDRVAKMSKYDTAHGKIFEKSKARKDKLEAFNEKQTSVNNQFEKVFCNEADDSENNNEPDFEQVEVHKKRKSDTVSLDIPRKLFKNPGIVSMIDRTQMSSRNAVGIASALLKAGGADLTEFSISPRQVHRQRDTARSVLSEMAMTEFKANEPEHLVLHWDSKLIDDAHGTKLERLSVLVSGAPAYIEGKLLGVPSLVNDEGQATSTGIAQFEGAKECVKLWDVKNNVRGLVFDTTASNSGVKQGACKRMEDWLDRPVLWLGCRHHIAELISKACWYDLFEDDLGPENEFFNQFKSVWPDLNTTPDTPTKKLSIQSRHLRELKQSALEFYTHILSTKNRNDVLPRDDYRVLAETSLLLLGGDLPAGRSLVWHKPGATHKARFMAFGIYANMMYSFIDQLEYDTDMVAALQRFVQFFTLIYIPYFLKASVGADSSFNDLDFYNKLFKYRRIDSVLAEKALEVLGRHGWYLVEQTVSFALFSNKVDRDTKSHIASKMLTFSRPEKFKLGKPKFPEIKPGTKLVDLVGSYSYLLFHILGVDHKWLSKDPIDWPEDSEFQKAEQFVRTVKTVNDCAERGVKMISDYETSLTKDESVRDWLLQGVELNRRKYPNFNVQTFNK